MLALSSEKRDYFFSKLFLLIQASAFHPRGPFWQVGVIYVLWFWKKKQNFLLKHCFEQGYPTSPTLYPHVLSAVESRRMWTNWINLDREKWEKCCFCFVVLRQKTCKYLAKEHTGTMTHLLSRTTIAISRLNMQMISMFYASNASAHSSKHFCWRVNVRCLRSLWPGTGLYGCVRPSAHHQVCVNAIWMEVIGAIIHHQGAVAAASQKHDQQKI